LYMKNEKGETELKQDRLSELSMEFAIEIVKLSQMLENRREYVLSRQIRKSGTSIGANVRESRYAQSRADFVSKLQIALKETAETDFWLEILYRTNYISKSDYDRLYDSCRQILAILIKAIKTSIANGDSE